MPVEYYYTHFVVPVVHFFGGYFNIEYQWCKVGRSDEYGVNGGS